MAVYKIFPTQDASLYTESSSMNTGLDPILECSTYFKSGVSYTSRYLVQFSNTEITNVLNTLVSGSNFKTYLRNFKSTIYNLNTTSILYFYPASGSWSMGTGKYLDYPLTTNGVSWLWLNYSGSTLWPTSSFGAYATASFDSSNPGGGVWFTGSSLGLNVVQTQSFNYTSPLDITVDVTNTVLNWYSGSLPNNGFLVKQQSSDEFPTLESAATIFKYYSMDTNTIYPPQLEFRWNDYIFNTGSSAQTILTTPESFISIYNNEGTYYSESIARFRIAATPKYPARVFITSSLYNVNYYLPESRSLYAVKDSTTNEFVINFDSTYTRISADGTSSYFDVYMNGLEPERYYTILIQTVVDGVTKVFDENILFKVSQG